MPARQTADSAHQNAYRGGVLSGSHWAERILANDQLLSPPTSSPGADSPYLTSNQLAYPAKVSRKWLHYHNAHALKISSDQAFAESNKAHCNGMCVGGEKIILIDACCLGARTDME